MSFNFLFSSFSVTVATITKRNRWQISFLQHTQRSITMKSRWKRKHYDCPFPRLAPKPTWGGIIQLRYNTRYSKKWTKFFSFEQILEVIIWRSLVCLLQCINGERIKFTFIGHCFRSVTNHNSQLEYTNIKEHILIFYTSKQIHISWPVLRKHELLLHDILFRCINRIQNSTYACLSRCPISSIFPSIDPTTF